MVEDGHVGVHVVQIVGVWRVVVATPARWRRTVQVEDVMLRFGLVVNAVESNHLNIKTNVLWLIVSFSAQVKQTRGTDDIILH